MRRNPRGELTATISNPGKVFWPEEKYTKLDLATFYGEVFSVLKPYVDDRILTARVLSRRHGGAMLLSEAETAEPATRHANETVLERDREAEGDGLRSRRPTRDPTGLGESGMHSGTRCWNPSQNISKS